MKILIIGKTWVEPNSSAAGKRMLQIIELLQSYGYEITFASTASHTDFEFDLQSIHVAIQTIVLNDPSFDEFILQLNPNIVIYDRFMTEEQFGWRVQENCPESLQILDTEDLHFLRKGREQAAKENRPFVEDDYYNDTTKRELASIYRCDCSLIISKYEIELLQDRFKITASKLMYLPLFYNEIANQDIVDFDKRKDLVFIGNFLHQPNWDAVQSLKEIWKSLRSEMPDALLKIYGAYPSQKVLQLHNPKERFEVLGRAESSKEVLQNARLLVAPLRFGAGLKGKVLEAMQFGTPVVTTSIGVEGIATMATFPVQVSDGFENWNETITSLYYDETKWQAASQLGLQIIVKDFSNDNFSSLFKEKLDNLIQHLTKHRQEHFIGTIMQHHTMLSSRYLSKWIVEKNKR